MLPQKSIPKRFIGLDLHKYYLIATAVDHDLNRIYGPKRIDLTEIQDWVKKTLTPDDAIVLEMTGNTWQVYDELQPFAHSVTVVHPPHVSLIVRAQDLFPSSRPAYGGLAGLVGSATHPLPALAAAQLA